MELEWKKVKTGHKTGKSGQVTGKMRATFYNNDSYVTISERKYSNRSYYSFYYFIKTDVPVSYQMKGLRALPNEVDTMEKAIRVTETQLREKLRKRFDDASLQTHILRNVIQCMNK